MVGVKGCAGASTEGRRYGLTLTLLVPPIAAQNANYSLASDHLAVGAPRFY